MVGGVAARLDPDALSESISALLASLQQQPQEMEQRGLVAREEAVRHHGMSAMLDRLLMIYGECRGRPLTDRRSVE